MRLGRLHACSGTPHSRQGAGLEYRSTPSLPRAPLHICVLSLVGMGHMLHVSCSMHSVVLYPLLLELVLGALEGVEVVSTWGYQVVYFPIDNEARAMCTSCCTLSLRYSKEYRHAGLVTNNPLCIPAEVHACRKACVATPNPDNDGGRSRSAKGVVMHLGIDASQDLSVRQRWPMPMETVDSPRYCCAGPTLSR